MPVPDPARGVAGLLAARLATDAASPLLTFYDDATGERTELSATTFDNWVAKTANLLVDGLSAGPGDAVALDLPLHWQAAAVLVAVYAAGAHPAADGETAVAAFVAEDRLGDPPDADELVGLSLRPMAGRLAGSWPGVLDYAAEVPAYGDRFAAVRPDAAQVALVAAAVARAAGLGVTAADRVLVTGPDPDGLLVPLAAGASVVACRHADPAALARRLTTERVTAALPPLPAGTNLPAGVRTLG